MTEIANPLDRIGAVAIGRNEGERLVRCLASLQGAAGHLVYVDSGSTDGSVAAALAAGAEVVELDMLVPFTAARARNAGLDALLASGTLDYVQFVDGDCELQPDWVARARTFLDTHPKAAVACGRRRERFPGNSIYNRLCDQEWNTPIGRAAACGGDALMRVAAIRQVGCFDASLIAGEEPELCLRLHRAGWEVYRLDAEMTLHDAAMTRFGQFCKRMERSGWAYAEGADRYGSDPERYNMREIRRIWLWGAIIPSVTLLLTFGGMILAQSWLLALAVLGPPAYLAMMLRIAQYRNKVYADPWPQALTYGLFLTLGRPWELKGALKFHAHKIRGGSAKIIEYKPAPKADT